MAFTQWTTCANNVLSPLQIFLKYLLVQDQDGLPAIKVITANDALVSSLSDKRITNLSNAAQGVKAAPGNILGWNIINPNASAVYVKFYDKAFTSVNPASDIPTLTLMVPSNGSVYQEANCVQQQHAAAISVRATTLLIDTDITAPATNLTINVKYN